MNWFQKILLSQQIVEPSPLGYLEIGHDYENFYENILWVYWDGTVKTIKQSEGTDDHVEDFPGVDRTRAYAGRFEPSTGRLSIIKPWKARFYDVPPKLINRLYEKFPNIKEIHIF